jgi:hypothetical protein
MRKSAAIFLALGLSVSALAGSAQAAGGHFGGGHSGGGGAAAHFGGGGHFGGHGGHFGGHNGGHFGGHHGGGYGYGYGALGFGLGLGALYYYDNNYAEYDGYGPVPRDYHDTYPDASAPDAVEQGAPPDVPGYWYRCDDPAGYYPYVGICPHPWQAVPAVPPPSDAH